ncbi:MAG TPA: hypothetical protein VFW33_11875, partial [Gemmataceae bacterium]|nr:hypothetical protein [Gemmataceae bacterium]
VEHVSSAAEVIDGKTAGFSSKLKLTKRWEVKDVDGAGVATLEMSLTAMRHEMTPPDGKTLVFDSADPDGSDAAMKADLSKYVGAVLAVVRVDGLGRVVEVKESKHGPASKFESDLPFKLVLPGVEVKEGAAWERKYKVTLEPPQGTGEKFDARQSYTCRSVKDGAATVEFTTGILNPPQSVADQRPLLPAQTAGTVVFDLAAGVMKSARVTVEKELKGYQGEGSSYRLNSSYTEELVGGK